MHYVIDFAMWALLIIGMVYLQASRKARPIETIIMALMLSVSAMLICNTASAHEIHPKHHARHALKHVAVKKVHKEPTKDELERAQRLCVARAIYKEARGETTRGKTSVGYVITTRAERGYKGNTTYCGVVYHTDRVHGKTLRQFSWTGKPFKVKRDDPAWVESQMIALLVTQKAVPNPTPGAEYFHARYVHVRMAKYRRVIDHQVYESDDPYPPS